MHQRPAPTQRRPPDPGRCRPEQVGFSLDLVEKRIEHVESEPTYLVAPVEIVASYRTCNRNTSALEHLLHRAFSEKSPRLSQAKDGLVQEPSEWCSAPLQVVNRATDLIPSGDLSTTRRKPKHENSGCDRNDGELRQAWR